MLIKLKAKIPKIVIGIMLAVSLVAMGMLFESSRHQPSNQAANTQAGQIQATHKPDPFSLDWLTHDGVVFFTGVLSLIAAIQAALFVWQLIYMRIGVSDAETAANASTRQAVVAEEQLIATRRPWLNVEVAAVGHATFDKEDMKFCVTIHCRNTGRTPALDVTIQKGVYLRLPDGEELLIKQRQLCDARRRVPIDDGKAIFPNDRMLVSGHVFRIPKEQWDAGRHIENERNGIMPTIFGCVDYRFTFGDITQHHQTRFAYDIREMDGEKALLIVPEEDGMMARRLHPFEVALGEAFHAD